METCPQCGQEAWFIDRTYNRCSDCLWELSDQKYAESRAYSKKAVLYAQISGVFAVVSFLLYAYRLLA